MALLTVKMLMSRGLGDISTINGFIGDGRLSSVDRDLWNRWINGKLNETKSVHVTFASGVFLIYMAKYPDRSFWLFKIFMYASLCMLFLKIKIKWDQNNANMQQLSKHFKLIPSKKRLFYQGAVRLIWTWTYGEFNFGVVLK